MNVLLRLEKSVNIIILSKHISQVILIHSGFILTISIHEVLLNSVNLPL